MEIVHMYTSLTPVPDSAFFLFSQSLSPFQTKDEKSWQLSVCLPPYRECFAASDVQARVVVGRHSRQRVVSAHCQLSSVADVQCVHIAVEVTDIRSGT